MANPRNNNQSAGDGHHRGRGGNNHQNFQNNNNNQQQHHDRKRNNSQHHQQTQSHNQQKDQSDQNQQYNQQQQSHRENRFQRDRSGQRGHSGPHPDSSMGSMTRNQPGYPNQDYSAIPIHPASLGSIRFIPGASTRDLGPIETKPDPSKKFTGRCRLFVGNLPHNTTEEKIRTLFEPHGEIGEVFLGPKSSFAFIKMDTRQNAEAARDAIDCTTYEGRVLRVRVAAHAAAIRVKHLSPQVTNELLAYAFRFFGEIERAVVVVDDKGKSIGEGIVEYSKKQSAQYAIKRCQQECFMLTAIHKPVLVEPFDQHDEDEGLPEKSINKNANEFKEQREVGPRFAEQGTFEHNFALRWKELYDIEKQKRDSLEQELQQARNNLEGQIVFSKRDHEIVELKNKLQQLEDEKLRIQQQKEHTSNSTQQGEELRRQQDMLLRQRDEEVMRMHQMGDSLAHQESMRMQANAMQNMMSNQERTETNEVSSEGGNGASSVGPRQTEADSSLSMNQMNMMPQMVNQQRSFADVTMMGLNPPFMPVQQMGIAPPISQSQQIAAPNLFGAFMSGATMNDLGGNSNFTPQNTATGYMQPVQDQTQNQGGFGRRPRSNNYTSGNNTVVATVSDNNNRSRKRPRY